MNKRSALTLNRNREENSELVVMFAFRPEILFFDKSDPKNQNRQLKLKFGT